MRFFCKISDLEIDNTQTIINNILGSETIVNLKANGKSSTSALPYEYYFSSGIIESEYFFQIEDYFLNNLTNDNVFIEWDINDFSSISSYYDGLYDIEP